jgi:hypothetical protein
MEFALRVGLDKGGVTFLADWDYIALNNGRDVRIAYDSDVMTKPNVRQSLERITEHLQRKGAHVTAVYLPGGVTGKVGVDDYLALGHTMDELEALVEAPRPAPSAAAPPLPDRWSGIRSRLGLCQSY